MNLSAQTFEGYLPWLAATTQLEASAFIVDGRDFYWTSGGVKSLPPPRQVRRLEKAHVCEKPALFCEDNEIQTISGGAIRDNRGELLYAAGLRPDAEQVPCPYRWSKSTVGCDVIYTHPCYCPVKWTNKCEWSGLETPAAGPIYGSIKICNRLVLLLCDTVAWSAVDDACDFDASLESGAGFQALNLANYGTPLGIHAISNDAALVQTTNGSFIMAASQQLIYDSSNSPTVGAVVFEFTELTASEAPCKAPSAASVNGVPLWMADGGLRQFSEGAAAPFQPDLSSWITEQRKCRNADVCISAVPGLSAAAMQVGYEDTYLYQYDLQKLGHISGVYDQLLMCDKQLYGVTGHTLYHFHDSNVTAPDTFVVTSAMRLPKLDGRDRRREFVAEIAEVYHPPTDCTETSYTVEHAALDDDWLPLDVITAHPDMTTYELCATELYHRLKFTGTFHISGMALEGRIGGLNRCP